MVVTDCDGAVFVCGADQPHDVGPKAQLRVLKEIFWVRMLLFADMVRQNSVSITRYPWRATLMAGVCNARKLRAARNLGLCGKFHVR